MYIEHTFKLKFTDPAYYVLLEALTTYRDACKERGDTFFLEKVERLIDLATPPIFKEDAAGDPLTSDRDPQ